MQRKNLAQYRTILIRMRDRVLGGVDHVVESIREDANPTQNISSLPVHLADVAPEALDADLHVLETENGLAREIQDALKRLDDGTFGVCESCGARISEQRLKAIPFASQCIECARSGEAGAGNAAREATATATRTARSHT
jgi:DnaK suppressor protein